MEMVEIVATANFVSSRVGSVTRKQRLTVPRYVADEFVRLGLAKVNPRPAPRRQNPPMTGPLDGGGVGAFVSSPVDQASRKPIAILLKTQDGKSSSSTTVGGVRLSPTPSGPATEPGGMFTTKPSNANSQESAGRKTTRRRKSTTSTVSEASISLALAGME